MGLSIHDPAIQDQIIEKMLEFTPTYGWSHEALKQAVVKAGFPERDAYRVFEGDLEQALKHFVHMIDRQLNEKLPSLNLASLRVRDRIATAVMIRLEILAPYRAALPKILSYQLFPTHSIKAFQTLFLSMGEIWYAAGDQATDFNYYSKRLLLSGVYASSFLFWLKDQSVDFVETRAFVQRRIDQVMKIPSFTNSFKRMLQPFGQYLKL